MHACYLTHTFCNVCLVLADSGITFGFVVAATVAASTGSFSVCASAGGTSTMSGTARALSFLLFFLMRVMVVVVVIICLQRDE